LAEARPDLAIKDKNGDTWQDNKNLAWVDPASKEVWDYNIAIARDAIGRGFDEINFDYIRFPSDGDLTNVSYPFWDKKTSKREVIKSFFAYLREALPRIKISADVFGQTTIENNDLTIGQIIEDAYQYFDYVAPMLYPSHYTKGFLNFYNPAMHPYEVIKYSMDSAINRLITYNQQLITTTSSEELSVISYQSSAKLRPWLQAFNLGAIYTPDMIQKEIQAVFDAASSTPELIHGYMLWNSSNRYHKEAVMPLTNNE